MKEKESFFEKINKREKLKSIYISEKEARKVGIDSPSNITNKEDLEKIEYLYYCMISRWKSELPTKYDEKKDKYLTKELVLLACSYINNNTDDIKRLQDIIKSELIDDNLKENKYIILECLSCFCDIYIRLKFRDIGKNDPEQSSVNMQNQISISMTVQKIENILEELPGLKKFIIKLVQMDLFNGIFDRKYALFKLLNEAFIDTLQFNDLIVLYRYLKLCLFFAKPDIKNEKEEIIYKKVYEYLLSKIENEGKNKNQNILKYCKKEKYSSEIYEMAKDKYKQLIEDLLYKKIPIKDSNLIFSYGYFNGKFDEVLGDFEKDILMEEYNFGINQKDDISNTLYFNYLDCSILLRNYTKDSFFYLKLIKCLIYICSNSSYPFCNIENAFMLLFDVIHLHKKNIPLQYLSQFLYCIDNSMNNDKIISRFFLVPLFQVKLLIFCHDIWDMLIENQMGYGYNDFYIIKSIIDKLNYNPWFRAFVENIENINFLYYYFIFKKAVRKIKMSKDLYGSIKYLEIVSNNIKLNKELTDTAGEWLESINDELGLTNEKKE